MTKKKAPGPLRTATDAEDSPTAPRTTAARATQRANVLERLRPSLARVVKDAERAWRVVGRATLAQRVVDSPASRVLEENERIRRIVEPPGTEMFRRMLREIEESYEYTLLSDSSTPDEKREAARALAELLPPPTTSPNQAAKRKARMLARIAGHQGPEEAADWSRRELLAPALLRAAEERHTPQPIRIGTRWVGGSRKPVVPSSLRIRYLSAWLRQRALRMVEEALSEKPRKQPTTVTLEESDAATRGATGELTLDEIDLLTFAERNGKTEALRSLAEKIAGR